MLAGWTSNPSRQKLKTLREIVRLLQGRDWCTFDEFMEATDRNWRSVSDALTQLKGDEQAFAVSIPGARGRLLWRRTTRSIVDTVRTKRDGERVTMTELPWRLKLSFVKKVGELRRQNVIKHGLAYWAMADVAAEHHMVRNGLCQARPRPEEGLYYECGWMLDPDYNPSGSSSLHAAYTFNIGFAARTNFKTIIPPFVQYNDGDGGRGMVSEEYGFLSGTDCEYEMTTEPHSTTLWLSPVSKISASPLGNAVQAPTTEQLIEETGAIMRAGVQDHPALSLFMPLPTTSLTVELLSAKKEEKPR